MLGPFGVGAMLSLKNRDLVVRYASPVFGFALLVALVGILAKGNSKYRSVHAAIVVALLVVLGWLRGVLLLWQSKTS